MGNYKTLSVEEIDKIVNLYNSGLSSQKVQKITGHNPQTILSWVKKRGFKVRTRAETLLLSPPREYAHLNNEGKLVKICTECKTEQDSTESSFSSDNLDKLSGICRSCRNKRKRNSYPERKEKVVSQMRQARRDNPARFREYDMKKRFKFGLEEFERMFEEQGRKCAACGSTDSGEKPPRTWHIDHDHSCCPTRRRTCGKCVRGILCRWCNMSLGNAKDDPARLRALANYVESYQKTIS